MKMWRLLISVVLCVGVVEANVIDSLWKRLQAMNRGIVFVEPTYPPPTRVCGNDYECSHKETCNAYTKNCEGCKLRGELCRRSGNCCNEDLRCIWGKCIDPLKTDGKKNHRCYNQKDCRPGFCCAKYEGESVCRPLLLEGDSCEVPPGGISFTINHKCPCGKGLRCQAKSTVRKHDLRCAYTNATWTSYK